MIALGIAFAVGLAAGWAARWWYGVWVSRTFLSSPAGRRFLDLIRGRDER